MAQHQLEAKSYSWLSYVNCLAQDCSHSIVITLELMQSCTKPSTCNLLYKIDDLMQHPQYFYLYGKENIDGVVQDCSNSIANALELLQSCTKPSIHICIKLPNNNSDMESPKYSVKKKSFDFHKDKRLCNTTCEPQPWQVTVQHSTWFFVRQIYNI